MNVSKLQQFESFKKMMKMIWIEFSFEQSVFWMYEIKYTDYILNGSATDWFVIEDWHEETLEQMHMA